MFQDILQRCTIYHQQVLFPYLRFKNRKHRALMRDLKKFQLCCWTLVVYKVDFRDKISVWEFERRTAIVTQWDDNKTLSIWRLSCFIQRVIDERAAKILDSICHSSDTTHPLAVRDAKHDWVRSKIMVGHDSMWTCKATFLVWRRLICLGTETVLE